MFHKIAKVCQTIFILLIFIYAMLLIWCPSVVHAETIKGKAKVIDGDTIEIQGEKIRLQCIDTPESSYRGKIQYCLDNETDCGFYAKKVLLEAVRNKEIICEYTKRDVYGRILGMCQEYYWNIEWDYTGTLNYRMVTEGYAWWYNGGKECKPFKEAMEEAQKYEKGLWWSGYGGFKEPKLWRKTRSND